MKYLHTMVRVSNIEESLDFYCNKLGLVEIRRHDSEAGRFTLVFLAAPGDADRAGEAMSPCLEITWNWDPEEGIIPIIIPQDFLNLYNFGFAQSQGLPQVPKGVISMVNFKIRLKGSFGTGQQRPSFTQRFGFDPGNFIGNPDLKNELAITDSAPRKTTTVQRCVTAVANTPPMSTAPGRATSAPVRPKRSNNRVPKPVCRPKVTIPVTE